MNKLKFPLKALVTAKLQRISDGQPVKLKNVFVFEDEKEYNQWLKMREEWISYGKELEPYYILIDENDKDENLLF